jgi:hypothetical protein
MNDYTVKVRTISLQRSLMREFPLSGGTRAEAEAKRDGLLALYRQTGYEVRDAGAGAFVAVNGKWARVVWVSARAPELAEVLR